MIVVAPHNAKKRKVSPRFFLAFVSFPWAPFKSRTIDIKEIIKVVDVITYTNIGSLNIPTRNL